MQRYVGMSVWRGMRVVTIGAALSVLMAACGSTANKSTSKEAAINVGLVTTTTGGASFIGVPNVNGVKLAISDINAHGGLLGHHVNLIVRNDAGSASTGVAEVRSLISSSHIVALFGPDNSANAVAYASLIRGSDSPFITDLSNDVSLTNKYLTPLTVMTTPNTVMEPAAVAQYIKSHFTGAGPVRLAVVAPDYNFGLSSIASLKASLTKLGVRYKVVASELPSPTATSFTQYLPGLISAKPSVVFAVLYGGQLISFTNEAAQVGLFKATDVIGYYGVNELTQLPGSLLNGHLIGIDRAPFWTYSGAEVTHVVDRYHTTYNSWPSQWSMLGYAAVQTWEQGVKSAGTFSGSAVVKRLVGHSSNTILGNYEIRACDHQALMPEYVGPVSSSVSGKYGVHIFSKTYAYPGLTTVESCSASLKLR